MSGTTSAGWPVVAVVDQPLVARRRRVAQPALRIAAPLIGVGAVGAVGPWPAVVRTTLLVIALLACGVSVWALPWAGPRPGSSWYLGIEREGLRLAHGLAAGGQVFLPWEVVASVRTGRYLGVVRALRIRVTPSARPWLVVFDPGVVDTLLGKGFAVGLQGTSMTPQQVVDLVARTRPPAPPDPPGTAFS